MPETACFRKHVGHPVEAGVIRKVFALLANLVTDVESGKIADRIRPHCHAPVKERPVNGFRRGALEQHQLVLPTIAVEHPIADEAETVPDHDADFAKLSRQ